MEAKKCIRRRRRRKRRFTATVNCRGAHRWQNWGDLSVMETAPSLKYVPLHLTQQCVVLHTTVPERLTTHTLPHIDGFKVVLVNAQKCVTRRSLDVYVCAVSAPMTLGVFEIALNPWITSTCCCLWDIRSTLAFVL